MEEIYESTKQEQIEDVIIAKRLVNLHVASMNSASMISILNITDKSRSNEQTNKFNFEGIGTQELYKSRSSQQCLA